MSVVNRVVLAPIKDSHLNANSQPNTPLKKRKSPGVLSCSSSPYMSKSFHIHKKSPKKSPQKSMSFSDFKANSLKLKDQNDTAGLAATKLKLKLQLAIYKLQQKKSNAVPKAAAKANLHYSSTYLTPPSDTSNLIAFVLPRDEIINSICQLPTPSKKPQAKPYSTSININLKTNSKVSKPTLEKIVTGNNKTSSLKLFQIKKGSSFYDSSHKQLPLVDPPKPLHINNLHITPAGNSAMRSTTNPFIMPVAAQAANHPNPSIYLNPLYNNKSFENQSMGDLPSINIILKTPIKNANSTRNLIPGNAMRQKSISLPHIVASNHDDTTIDEDNDNTIVNTTSNQDVLGSLREEPCSKKSILTSSPLANNFGTPNSFSVAKSLLQLGGYYR